MYWHMKVIFMSLNCAQTVHDLNLLDYITKLIRSIISDKDTKNVNMNVSNESWSVKWLLGNNFFLHIEGASMETMEIKRGDFSVNI